MPSPLLLLKIARWPGRESTAPLPLFSGPSPSPCGRWKSRGCIMEIWRLISAQLLPGSPCSCPAGWVERCALRAGVRGCALSRLGHATSPCGRATRREKGGTTATLSRGTALHVHGHSRDTHRTSPHRADADPFYPPRSAAGARGRATTAQTCMPSNTPKGYSRECSTFPGNEPPHAGNFSNITTEHAHLNGSAAR